MPRLQLTCATCRIDFSRWSWEVRHRRTFCSRKCATDGFAREGNPRWNGGRKKASRGYTYIAAPGHPKATYLGKYVREHYLVAERALGKPLPAEAIVHHVNGRKTENDNRNLVVCQDSAYHSLLHARERRIMAFGSVRLKQCCKCRSVLALEKFPQAKRRWDGRGSACLTCIKDLGKERYKRTRPAQKLMLANRVAP